MYVGEAKAPPIANEGLRFILAEVDTCYDRGICDQHGLPGEFLSSDAVTAPEEEPSESC